MLVFYVQAVEEYIEHNLFGNEAQQKLQEMDPNEFRKALAEGRSVISHQSLSVARFLVGLLAVWFVTRSFSV